MAALTPAEVRSAIVEDSAAYDAWFCHKIEHSIASDNSSIPHERVKEMAHALINRYKPG
jgi:hypothetical protein